MTWTFFMGVVMGICVAILMMSLLYIAGEDS
jgi:hypothetical protein